MPDRVTTDGSPDPAAADGSPAVDRLERLAKMLERTGLFIEDAPEVVGELRRDVAALVAERDALQAKADEYDEMESALRLDHAALNDAEVTIESFRAERKWIAAVNTALLEAHEAAVRDRDALQERAEKWEREYSTVCVAITLRREDAQGLYDHTGTMPYAPGSWSHNVRAALSESLGGVRS